MKTKATDQDGSYFNRIRQFVYHALISSLLHVLTILLINKRDAHGERCQDIIAITMSSGTVIAQKLDAS